MNRAFSVLFPCLTVIRRGRLVPAVNFSISPIAGYPGQTVTGGRRLTVRSRMIPERMMLALAALCVVMTGGTVEAKVYEPESITLANGMQVVAITDNRVPVVTHMVWY